MTTCEVCERTARAESHPCRFERGCLCWSGYPCGRESYGPDSWARTARIMRAERAMQARETDRSATASF